MVWELVLKAYSEADVWTTEQSHFTLYYNSDITIPSTFFNDPGNIQSVFS